LLFPRIARSLGVAREREGLEHCMVLG